MPEMHVDEPRLTFRSDRNFASGEVLHQLTKPSNGNGASAVLGVQEERRLSFRRALSAAGWRLWPWLRRSTGTSQGLIVIFALLVSFLLLFLDTCLLSTFPGVSAFVEFPMLFSQRSGAS
ncbi:hypothetical protein D1007_27216 [Hordeum vulgare]|uniref:Predicted protein n=1 Tax=Hordeum vulgare subsp. vulgare TaxID=112509 RepID=F2ED50_HORVV|nr:hypothetical protein D1007_27216 [Hordeum vulgare]BAK05272.1 predicted protein [Hordeum vulgare subsp. vulgare]